MDIRVLHTLDPVAMRYLRQIAEGLTHFPKHGELEDMRATLLAAIAASQALAAQEKTLEASIKSYVTGEPDRIAAAVAAALASAGVDDDTAANLIEAATAEAASSVTASLDAITTPGAGSGGDTNTDTVVGGNGDDTLQGGQGSDTITDPNNGDTLAGGQAGDTIVGGTGDDTLQGGQAGDGVPPGAN